MKKRLEELLKTPRMYYCQAVDDNSLEGLYELIKEHINTNTVMVEIGSFSGVSSELFAMHCKELNCVDAWEPYKEIGENLLVEGEKAFDGMQKNYKNIKKIKSTSSEAATLFENESLDFAYIDAAHDYENVKKDILAWLPKVKKGGAIGGHDYTQPDVKNAVQDVINVQATVYSDTSWYIKLV